MKCSPYLKILFCILLFPAIGFSQLKIDSFKTVLSGEQSNEQRLETLAEFSDLLRDERNPQSIQYFEQAIDLAKELGNWDVYADRSNLYADGYIYDFSKADTAVIILKDALTNRAQFSDSLITAKLLLTLSDALHFNGNVPEAQESVKKALNIYEQKNDSTIRRFAYANLFLGRMYASQGDIPEAQAAYEKAVDLYTIQNDTTYLLSAQGSFAALFSQSQIYGEADKIRQKMIPVAQRNGSFPTLVSEYLNMSMDERKQGNLLQERSLMKKAIEASRKITENYRPFYEFVSLSRITAAYGRAEMRDSLNFYYDQAKVSAPDFERDAYANHFFTVAEAYKHLLDKNYAQALEKTEEYKAFAKNGSGESMIYVEELYYNIYKAMGRDKLALEHFVQFSSKRDSMFNMNKANALSYYQTEYETEKKERTIVEQEASISQLNIKNKLNTRLYLSLLGLVAAISGVVLLWRNQQAARKRAALQQQFTQKLILSQENERKRISKELHDSVGQSLVLIKNKIHLGTGDSGDTEDLVSNTIQEVKTISRGLHPFTLDKLGLTASIQKLVNDADEGTEIFFSQEIENIDGILPKTAELNIYRIVQESLSNLIKHANTPSALVSVMNLPKRIEVMIKDNGVGFDLTEKAELLNSLGMKTLKERAEMLQAKFSLDSTKAQGTTIVLQVPK